MEINENKILYYKENDKLYLIFFNHIMAANISALYDIIKTDLNSAAIKNIFIDFYKCNYIDSTVIGTLIKIKTSLNKNNGNLILYNVKPDILNIFSHMGLKTFFTIKETEVDLQNIKKYTELETINTNIKPEFVLDAHNHIIKVSPSVKEEFDTLISILKSQIKK